MRQTDENIFSSVDEGLRLLTTIPVTTCSCKRSISGLRRLKTWLCNTTTEARLNSQAVIMFNHDVEINYENVVDVFAEKNLRRIT